jgi:hypothetical protein
MKLQPECIVCLFGQALRAAQLATSDERQHQQALQQLAGTVSTLSEDAIQVEVAGQIQAIIAQTTGDRDPYRDIKRHYNDLAVQLYPQLQKRLEDAEDPLLSAIRVAIAGNIVDFGVGNPFDLEHSVEDSFDRDFAIFDYEIFQTRLASAQNILYLGDNTGEIVFDRLLIQRLLQRGKRVTLAVRGGAAINDATLEDVRYVGLDELVDVITTGTALPGVVLDRASGEFKSHFNTADLIIAKGQGNFEGLSDADAPIAFLLKAKCGPIARTLGIEPGSLVFRASDRLRQIAVAP